MEISIILKFTPIFGFEQKIAPLLIVYSKYNLINSPLFEIEEMFRVVESLSTLKSESRFIEYKKGFRVGVK